jgi:hypothetical protein
MLRVYSYLFHLALALFLLAMAVVASTSTGRLDIDVLPWQGDDAAQWLIWGSIVGIISIVLAVTGIFRYLFPVYALTVLAIMIRGYFLQPYSFAGRESFYSTLWLVLGALLAFLASLTLFRFRRPRRA